VLPKLEALIWLKAFLMKRKSQPEDIDLPTWETTRGEGVPLHVLSRACGWSALGVKMDITEF